MFFASFFTFFRPFWEKSTKQVPKPCKNQHFCAFWGGALVPDWFPTGSRLVPDWFPTGSRLVPDFQKVVLEFAESGVKFWTEICRIGWFLGIWEVFWWVWGGWGLVWGCSGGGFGVAGAGVWRFWESFWWFLVIWKDGGRVLGIWRVWKDLEGFGGILKDGMISGDFYCYLTPLVSTGMVFYFSKSGNALPCW